MERLKKSLIALVFWGCPLAAWGHAPPPAEDAWPHLLSAAQPAQQTEWGLRYENGEGVSQNFDRAVQLYCAAARRGYADAQYHLGWLYANGRGVGRDDALAAAWFRLAAAQGDAQSRRILALVDDPGRVKAARCVLASGAEVGADVHLAANPRRREVAQAVHRLAPSYGLDPALVLAVIAAESAFNPEARSPKNAQGLMQLIPATAERFGVKDPFDPVQNLRGGMAYLRWLLAYFDGDVQLALAGYNAGEGAVERYRGVPPYPETQAYVARIIRTYGGDRTVAVTSPASAPSLLAASDPVAVQ